MKQFIEYIKQHFSQHSHFSITIHVLECLNYIETNVEEISQHAGETGVLRHPTNGLAFHLTAFLNPQMAKEQLLKLIAEVNGCLSFLLNIQHPLEQQKTIDLFLQNINDSTVGCMEARLRPALTFVALHNSMSCRNIHDLMETFMSTLKTSTESHIKVLLDFFAEQVEHYVPVQDTDKEIKPLNWVLVKNYLKEILAWETIDADWINYKTTLPPPMILAENFSWYFLNFKKREDATHYLSYVKSILPAFQVELARAKVKFDEKKKTYSFRLTKQQFAVFNFPLNLFSSLHYKIFFSKNQKGYNLCFASHEAAEKALNSFQNLPSALNKVSISFDASQAEVPYHFPVTLAQWDSFRESIRWQAKSRAPQTDYVIKSLRLDVYNYYPRFVRMVLPPFANHPLRPSKKQHVTVTGKGVFQRPGTNTVLSLPLPPKVPQYTPQQKAGFSKPQSASLGHRNFSPQVFGFNNRYAKLVGVLIHTQNILFSDRLYIYDCGTVHRPYDFFNYRDAQQYYEEKRGKNPSYQQKVLFNPSELNDFKKRISVSRANYYNEVLVRLRWGNDKTSQFFIASDTLEARLWAQEYSRIMKHYMLAHQLCQPDENLPICFYFPCNSQWHFKEYTQEEQQIDCLEAHAIYHHKEQREQKYREENYEFLLALSYEEIHQVFHEVFEEQHLILKLMAQGHIHLFHSLLEKAPPEKQSEWWDILKNALHQKEHLLLIPNILYYCFIAGKDLTLANFIFTHRPPHKIDFSKYKGQNPLWTAVQEGYTEWVDKLLSWFQNIDINCKNKEGHTLLFIAAEKGYADIVKILLDQRNIDINYKNDEGITALSLAARHGQARVVEQLLSQRNIDVHCTVQFSGDAPLLLAAQYGHIDVVKALLAYSKINVNFQNKKMKTPLLAAAEHDHSDIVKELIAHQNINVNSLDEFNNSPLLLAIRYGHANVIKILLAQPSINVNSKNNQGCTPLFFAARYGYLNEVNALLKQANIQINIKNNEHHTPFLVAASYGHKDIVLLLQAQLNIQLGQTNNYNSQALLLAACYGRIEVVKILLTQPNIQINYKNSEGNTPLLLAAYNGHCNVVKVLLEQSDIQVNCRNNKGSTPLLLAAYNGHCNVVKVLLTHPLIDVNYINDRTQAALIFAVQYASLDMLKALLSHKEIKVNIRNKYDVTPLTLAAARHNIPAIAELLGHPEIKVDLNNQKDWEALALLKNHPSYAAHLESFLRDRYLRDYLEKRSGNGDYTHWYGAFFGVKKEKKLNGAQSLIDGKEDYHEHEKALSEGELGKIYSLLLKNK